MEAEPVCLAPRDVLAPIDRQDRHFLITLHRPGTDAEVRLVFAVPAAAEAGPGFRDVLWWLAADAWVVERSDSDPKEWGAVYGYPPTAPAAARLFELHRQQRDDLVNLLGELDTRRLLSLYEAEVAPHRG